MAARNIDVDDLRRLVAEGLTTSQIGKQLGFTGNAVWKRAQRCGIAIGPDRSEPGSDRCGPSPVGVWRAERKAWWDANRARLVELVDAGLTSAAIAVELGVSRNAVMGRVHRTRLTLAREPTGGRKKRAPARVNPFPAGAGCVWPHGDPGADDFGFCGAATGGRGRPYCTRHERAAYLPPRAMSGEASFALQPMSSTEPLRSSGIEEGRD